MSVTGTMRGYGRAARHKAEAMGHQVKDRSMEKRLDRATQETERLRFENELLRDEVEETRSEHRKILDLVEDRLPQADEGHSHKGRWLVFLAAIGGAGYAVYRRFRSQDGEWEGAAQPGTSGIRRDTAVA
jgi:predicted  nucleic acid-binding Zn-ribbon protein